MARRAGSEDPSRADRWKSEDLQILTNRILQYGSRGTDRSDFLRRVLEMLIDFSSVDVAELRFREGQRTFHCRLHSGTQSFQFESKPVEADESSLNLLERRVDRGLSELCRSVVDGEYDASLPHFTSRGSFWTGDTGGPVATGRDITLQTEFKTLALIPLIVREQKMGLLVLMCERRDGLGKDEVWFHEAVADAVGVALAYRSTQVALRERVKELMCLYGIAQLAETPGASLEQILQGVTEVLPPGWLYPEIASARVILDGRVFAAPGFPVEGARLSAPILLAGKKRGAVEIAYREEMADLDEGPFLKEERDLIDTVAKELALVIERKLAEEQKTQLEEQLRHADRLATIGQLAAGVAHEINEPLGNILGFAQLARKVSGLPGQAGDDIEKIVAAALHAREVIRKLMIFARKMPPQKLPVSLNRVVEDALYFLEARCTKAGVRIRRALDESLPEVMADPAQLTQVLVNLVVNAIQAMPGGGLLVLETGGEGGEVWFAVEDSGVGMSEEIRKQIFVPFFTTKDVDEGTGLGLAVVHGIVTSHGGRIEVTSEEGSGSRVEVRLPLVKEETG
jgi:signal transduction histidine kinase